MREKTSHKLSPQQLISIHKVIDRYVSINKDVTLLPRNEIFGQLFGAKAGTAKNYVTKGGNNTRLPHKNFKHFCGKIDPALQQFPEKTREVYKSLTEELTRIYLAQSTLHPYAFKKKVKGKRNKGIVNAAHFFLREVIQQSAWYTYEREKGMVSKRVLEFQQINPNGACNFIIRTPHDTKLWKGEMYFIDGDDLLTGTCQREAVENEKEGYTHFTIRVQKKTHDLKVCTGHKTFLSQRIDNVVTKTIILEKKDKKEGLEPAIHEFGDAGIEESIRAFFFDPLRNRLTSPHRSPFIFNQETLDQWIALNAYPSKIHSSIEGVYQVFYKVYSENGERPGSQLEVDYLIISKNIKGQLEASFEERENGGVWRYWNGTVEEITNTHTVTISMKGPFRQSTDLGASPLYLMLTIPDNGGINIDTLTGVIVGITSKNSGPVARLIVLSKLVDGQPVKAFDRAVIEKFFDKLEHSSKVRPPYNDRVCNFEDLKNVIE